MNIDELLKAAIEKGSSDLHLKVGVYPMVRINGGLAPLDKFPKVNQEESVALAFSVMNPSQKEKFKERFELDLAYSAAGLGRGRGLRAMTRSPWTSNSHFPGRCFGISSTTRS